MTLFDDELDSTKWIFLKRVRPKCDFLKRITGEEMKQEISRAWDELTEYERNLCRRYALTHKIRVPKDIYNYFKVQKGYVRKGRQGNTTSVNSESKSGEYSSKEITELYDPLDKTDSKEFKYGNNHEVENDHNSCEKYFKGDDLKRKIERFENSRKPKKKRNQRIQIDLSKEKQSVLQANEILYPYIKFSLDELPKDKQNMPLVTSGTGKIDCFDEEISNTEFLNILDPMADVENQYTYNSDLDELIDYDEPGHVYYNNLDEMINELPKDTFEIKKVPHVSKEEFKNICIYSRYDEEFKKKLYSFEVDKNKVYEMFLGNGNHTLWAFTLRTILKLLMSHDKFISYCDALLIHSLLISSFNIKDKEFFYRLSIYEQRRKKSE